LNIGKQIKGNDLNMNDDDLTIQNIQARVRSPSIWMIANMRNQLLLTTSNRSEAAVGYATMDGDTSGCVAPIAGLSKVYIREYLHWVESDGPEGIGRLPEMALINNQQPTAELRPAQYKQTDEDDLMPYWLLDMIEGYVVKNRYVPVEIYKAIKREVDYDNNRLIADITKFFRLFSRNQWKRERYALSFHLDDHNLDPRTWCRTPILSGGYEEELAELQAYKI
jgi:NAD+ synthase (glutamine-hydrolysing)